MIDFKNISDPNKLKEYLVHTIKSYQSLAEKYTELNDQLISQLAINEVNTLDNQEKDNQIKRLTTEIVNLYRELADTKYGLSINIDRLIPEREDVQLHFEFVEGYSMK